MATSRLEFWGSGTARTLRTLWMAEEMALDYRHIPIGPRTGETMTPDFLALNPRHKIPVVIHGDVVLTESAAILIYLTETFELPDDFFRPQDAAQRIRHLEWCFFIMSELDANGLYTMRRHGPLRDIYGDAPVAVAGGQSYFLHQIDRMEERLRTATPYLMGSGISAADILFTTCLDWAADYDIPLPGHLMAYRERMTARPAYQRARAMNET